MLSTIFTIDLFLVLAALAGIILLDWMETSFPLMSQRWHAINRWVRWSFVVTGSLSAVVAVLCLVA